MDKKYTRGHNLIERYRAIYRQTLWKDDYIKLYPNSELIKTTIEEEKYAIEIIDIIKGKYAEGCGAISEDEMAELLEKAEVQNRKVGFIRYSDEITKDWIDNEGYIGIL